MKKVLVALSGGIDSAATALILKKRGYDVSAVTFDMSGDNSSVDSARGLAAELRIELKVADIRGRFRQNVIDYFIEGYMRGETPAPCSVCNPLVKWGALLDMADSGGFRYIATGHYCRIVERGGLLYIGTAADNIKDQSYYLWGLGQEVLSRAITPLGDFTKGEIRQMMKSEGFGYMSDRKESMGVCFLGKEGVAGFLEKHATGMPGKGDVVNTEGEIVGSHRGFQYYTIGQKRGFDLFGGGDAYVISIDAASNRLTVGDISMLYSNRIILKDYKAADINELLDTDNLSVKVRGIGINPEGYCTVRIIEENRLEVTVPSGIYAPANGQPAVFYIDDRVVGGGIVADNCL